MITKVSPKKSPKRSLHDMSRFWIPTVAALCDTSQQYSCTCFAQKRTPLNSSKFKLRLAEAP